MRPGADTDREIRKQRGFGLDLAVIDECGSWGPHLRELVEENVEPTLMDSTGPFASPARASSRTAGALGAGLAGELRVRYGLPIEATVKQEKLAFQSFIAYDLSTRRIKAAHPSPLTAEWSLLQKLDDGKTSGSNCNTGMIGIKLLDHVVVARDGHASLLFESASKPLDHIREHPRG